MGIYYGPHQEKRVQQYLKTNDEQLFEEEIYPLLREITYGVCGGKQFKPVSLYRSRAVIDGCISHLWECLRYKYDKKKGRTFSYLSACAFHYFCGVSKTYNKSKKTLLMVGQEMERQWINMHHSLYINSVDEEERTEKEAFYYNKLIPAIEAANSEMADGKYKKTTTEGILRVMNTIKRHDETTINKKALYLLIRGSAGVTTKQIYWTVNTYLRPIYLKVQQENI